MQLNVTTSVPGWAATGSCYLCRSVHESRIWLDTGIDIVGEGGLVVCNQCVTELGDAIGLVPATECSEAFDELRELRVKVLDLEQQAKTFNDLVTLVNLKAAER